MKESLLVLVTYNRGANADLYKLLRGAPEALLNEETGSYFSSIMGLANHILVSELGWLASLRQASVHFPALDSPALEFEHPGWRTQLYGDFEKLAEHRASLDELFVELVRESEEAVFTVPITLPGRKGRTTMQLAHILLHLMNHATHHRGAIAQILDERGVENDYSNLVFYAPMTQEDEG